uniref:RNase NYN domain-containing protein n=1 Tax=Electrophorus electricus TaxID=8005 RepID=A0AAY5EI16_ELEEL
MDLSADLGWRDDMRAEQHVEDEFTCPVVLRGSLLAQQSVVERLFGVILRIGEGLSSYTPQDGQIWLQLKGKKTEVEAAKLFVKGVVNQEAQKEVQYPEALHCVFCGAKGLFIDSLIKNTSAHIMVGSMGCLLISGLAEPVVKAYSLIMDLVDKYRDSQAQPYKAACESLESRRVFKSMVERLEDRHTLDLLVLPVLVKELLLDLVKQSALDLDFWDNVSVSAERETLLDLSENIDRLILREPRKNETLSSTILLNPNGTSQNLPISCSYEENMQDGNAQKWVGGASLDANKERESLQQDEHLLKFFTAMGYNEEVVGRVLARSGPQEPSQILDLVQQEQSPTVEDGAKGAKEDDFVLGVTKKAAASCGYTEEKVDAVFNNLPKIKPHQLILELQKEGMRKPEGGRLSERKRTEEPEEQEKSKKKEREKPDISSSSPPSVRGPPQPVYASPLHHNNSERQVNPTEAPVTKSKQKQGPPPAKAGAVVTGAQRFLEGLDMPFALQLNDDPGDPELRQIIIDGSNVAKSHGLGMFFSCRGIALAVQYFWSRGHRKITVFVPQWRQKKDPKIKEQHFMTELQDLGLLSFTPSREVLKQRINCYDDRFMLQLAQQTDGVIVTNDNMRDLVDESASWREIIKKRLLQYVFAGDLFMVPDDPLGRSGPHINDFLRMQNSHSFAGMSSSSSPSYHPRAQTEVLQYRERTPGGVHSAHGSGKGQAQAGKEMERTSEATLRLKQDLVQIFPGQESMVTMTLQCHPTVTDINKLSHFILESQGNV